MSKKLIVSAALIFAAAFATAQDYTIKMNVKVEGLPPEFAGFGEQEWVNYMKGDKYKREMTSMMGANTTSFDGKTMVFINEQMGDKSGYTASKEELEAANAKAEKPEAKPKIEYTTEKKMIAGYECNKVIVTVTGKDKKVDKINLWVTEKIKNPQGSAKVEGRRGMGMDFGDVKGYPLEIEINQKAEGQDLKVLISASEVLTTPIDDAVFKVDTEGYKMISFKEYQEKMKAAMANGAGH
jgi:hypothetical protein